jgi:hypothetical protein
MKVSIMVQSHDRPKGFGRPLASLCGQSCDPGAYTVIVPGASNATGIGIVEVFAQ